MPGWVHTLVQLAAVAAFLAGVALLASPAWALLVGGLVVGGGSVVVELAAARGRKAGA